MLDSCEEVNEFRSCPQYPNGLQWAKKANVIAVATERVIYILVNIYFYLVWDDIFLFICTYFIFLLND